MTTTMGPAGPCRRCLYVYVQSFAVWLAHSLNATAMRIVQRSSLLLSQMCPCLCAGRFCEVHGATPGCFFIFYADPDSILVRGACALQTVQPTLHVTVGHMVMCDSATRPPCFNRHMQLTAKALGLQVGALLEEAAPPLPNAHPASST